MRRLLLAGLVLATGPLAAQTTTIRQQSRKADGRPVHRDTAVAACVNHWLRSGIGATKLGRDLRRVQ